MAPMTTSVPAHPSHERVPWLKLLLAFVATRLWLALAAVVAHQFLPPGKFYGEPARPLDFITRWDATWFLEVARNGYSYTPGAESSVAFFPMFPLLVRGMSKFFAEDAIAALLVSNLALFAACVLLWTLARDVFAGRDGRRAVDPMLPVLLLLGYSVTIFHSLAYSESTFLVCMLGSLVAARRERWLLAGALGYAAALSRNVGFLLCVPLAIEYFRWDWRRPLQLGRPLLGAWPIALPPLGLVSWAGYLWWQFGDPLTFLHVQSAWGRGLSFPWEPFREFNLSGFPVGYRYWFVTHALLALGLLIQAFRVGLPLSLCALAACMLTLNLSGRHLEAIPRLVSVIAPLYLAAAATIAPWRAARLVALALGLALAAVSAALFTGGYWFT